MTGRTSKRKQPATSGPKTRSAQYALLGAVCALVIGVYAWSAKSGVLELSSSAAKDTYYNLLVDGFRAGQLNLKREVPPGLAQLAAPYDPLANSPYWSGRDPLLDLSYYKGKLYLYFGVTPALVLFWPYVAVTGHYLLHKDAVVIFFSVGFLASVTLLWAVWRRYFAEVSVGVVAAGALAIGWANFTLACLQRCDVYEVAMSCGYALTMVTLTLVWKALHATRGRAWWLAAASLAYGLAVGARPSLLFGAVILLVPVFQGRSQKSGVRSKVRISVSWKLVLAATTPIMLIGLGLMLYNFLRFDSPFEFGHQYALNWVGQHSIQPFSPRFLWVNFGVYFLEPARWSGRFPFVHDITSPPLPVGHVGIEHVFGVLPNLPLVGLVLAVPLAWRGRLGEPRRALRWFGMMLVLLFGMCALTLVLFFAASIRYQIEFLPALLLLAVLGILGLERALAGRLVWRGTARWGWGLLLAFSVSFNWFAMFDRSAQSHVWHGVASSHKGQMDEAIVQYQKALKLQPDNADAHSSLGAALLEQGKVWEAIWPLEKALRLKPNMAEAHNNLGMALSQVGRLTEAMGHLEQALRLMPNFAEAHCNYGAALFHLGRVPEAIGFYEQALRLKPDFADAHKNLAVALFQQGKVNEGIVCLEQALRLDSYDVDAHFEFGKVQLEQGKLSEAIGHLEQVLRLKPEHLRAHISLAAALVQAGRAPEAIGHLEQALQLKPDSVEAHNNLGTALLQLGRVPEAMGHYEQALRLKPEHIVAHRNLAWVLATCGDKAIRNGARSVELAQAADRQAGGKDPIILDTLAAAYAEAGRFDDAVRTAQVAIELMKAAGQREGPQRIQARLQLYQAGRPYHEPPVSQR